MITRRIVISLGLAHALAAIGVMPPLVAQPASALQSYTGRKRPLIVFAPAADHPLLARQRNEINRHRLALEDNDVVVLYVVGGALTVEWGPGSGMSAAALRTRFRVSEGAFRVLFLGKDGAVKLEAGAVIDYSELSAELQRRPLRREDIRKAGH